MEFAHLVCKRGLGRLGPPLAGMGRRITITIIRPRNDFLHSVSGRREQENFFRLFNFAHSISENPLTRLRAIQVSQKVGDGLLVWRVRLGPPVADWRVAGQPRDGDRGYGCAVVTLASPEPGKALVANHNAKFRLEASIISACAT
jgi:hypothetical protein